MLNAGDSMLIRSLADVTTHIDRGEMLHAVARLIRDFLDARTVALYRVMRDEAATRLVRILLVDNAGTAADAAAGGDDTVHPETLEGDGDWKRCVNQQAVVTLPGPSGHVLTAFPSENHRGEVLGVFVTDTERRLQARDVRLLRSILHIVRNHVALLDYGQRDTLTGLLNRKTFESEFDRIRMQLAAAGPQAEDGLHGWLGLIDIDRFKTVNDTYGHLFGDEVLLLVSQLIRRAFRSSDLLYRFGGEEFVVLLPSLAERHAEQAFERLRMAIEAHAFPQVGRVTISLGWTRINALDGPTTCLSRADAALYKAKNDGRNRSCRYESFATAAPAQDGDIELF